MPLRPHSATQNQVSIDTTRTRPVSAAGSIRSQPSKVDWDMKGDGIPKTTVWKHGSTLHEHIQWGKLSGQGRKKIEHKHGSCGHASRFGGRCGHAHFENRQHGTVPSHASSACRPKSSNQSRASAARRVQNARTIARQILKTEDATRRLAANQAKSKESLKTLANKNEAKAPVDFVPGECNPTSTMFPKGLSMQEAQFRAFRTNRPNPEGQEPFYSAGGPKAGTELNSWQEMLPRADVSESHPPLVPEPKNLLKKMPSRALFQGSSPMPRKTALHVQQWTDSIRV